MSISAVVREAVDCVSFGVMRRMGIRKYLWLDPHFDEQGFTRYAPAG